MTLPTTLQAIPARASTLRLACLAISLLRTKLACPNANKSPKKMKIP